MENNKLYLQQRVKTTPISDDYQITGQVLGLGINGKVVECYSLANREKFALKVSMIYCNL